MHRALSDFVSSAQPYWWTVCIAVRATSVIPLCRCIAQRTTSMRQGVRPGAQQDKARHGLALYCPYSAEVNQMRNGAALTMLKTMLTTGGSCWGIVMIMRVMRLRRHQQMTSSSHNQVSFKLKCVLCKACLVLQSGTSFVWVEYCWVSGSSGSFVRMRFAMLSWRQVWGIAAAVSCARSVCWTCSRV